MKKAGIAVAVITAVALAAFLIYDGIFNKTSSADFFAMDTVISAEVVGADSKSVLRKLKKSSPHLIPIFFQGITMIPKFQF